MLEQFRVHVPERLLAYRVCVAFPEQTAFLAAQIASWLFILYAFLLAGSNKFTARTFEAQLRFLNIVHFHTARFTEDDIAAAASRQNASFHFTKVTNFASSSV